MANTCSEDYVFYGVDNDAKSKAELEELRKLIQECKETKDAWIGNIALSAGLGQPPMNCRSSVIDVDEADPTGAFRVYLDSAWDSKFEFWCWLIDNRFPHITYARCAEECGEGIYEKYDPDGMYFPDKYYLDTEDIYDINGEYFEGDYFTAAKDLLERVKAKLGWPVSTIAGLKKMIREYDGDGSIWLRECVEVSA